MGGFTSLIDSYITGLKGKRLSFCLFVQQTISNAGDVPPSYLDSRTVIYMLPTWFLTQEFSTCKPCVEFRYPKPESNPRYTHGFPRFMFKRQVAAADFLCSKQEYG